MDLVRVGLSLRALRIRARLTQQQLAVRSRTTRGKVGHVERGRADQVSVGELDRIAATLGARLDVLVRWQGELLDRLLDEAHAATVAAAVARLERLGWEVALEVSFSIWGERGSIDILAWHEPTRTILAVEVKSVVADIQSLLHGLDRKTRLAREIGDARGWHARSVARLVVVGESPTSRSRARRHAVILDAALPLRGPNLRDWLRAPKGEVAGLLFLSNASSAGNTTPIWRRQRVRTASRAPLPVERRSLPENGAIEGESATSDSARRLASE